jgi:enoyl-CoA hydratase/carnithine racemase
MTDNITVHYKVVEQIATITLDRPEARNALNKATRDALTKAFERFAEDDNALVAILTATGDKVFCAGGDLKEMSDVQLKIPPPDFIPYWNRTVHTDKPVIVAVNGHAFAGGFLLTQMCDLCIAAENASFAITEAKRGRGAPWAGPLPWLIPPRIAMELLITAEPISAARAYDIGLVNKVVPLKDLQSEAMRMARGIAENAPMSVRAGKRMVYAVAQQAWEQSLDVGEALFAPVYHSEDAQEGPLAFKEKRPPKWQGK